MTDPNMALREYLRNLGADLDKDFPQESVRMMSQMLMESEVTQKAGAQKHVRTPERVHQRNGYRESMQGARNHANGANPVGAPTANE